MSLVTASNSIVARMGEPDVTSVRRKLGRYHVLFELGRGGMATVHLAVTQSAPGVSKLVALKSLLPEYAREADACAMFLDEARLAVQLNHGNVVQTYEVGKEAGCELIVMEYLEGHSLASILRRAHKRGQTLPLGLHLRLLMQVLEGLHCTHELRGYDGTPLYPVHRDVSPQNVFITYDGRAKLLDFGIAKAASSTTKTATGVIKGKIAYMAPEQMSGKRLDRRADVYAVGCMLWAAATGRKLWHKVEDVKIMHDVIMDGIPTPSSQNPACDPELERIVMKALAKAESRYSSAQELHDELERFCEAKGMPDRSRELGRVIANLFAEDRAEMRARVEKELSLLQNGVAYSVAGPPADSVGTPPSGDAAQLTSSTRTVSVSNVNSSSAKAGPSPPLRRWLLAAPLALLVLVYLALPKRPEAQATVLPAASVAPTAARPAEDRAETAVLELRSQPATAQLFLDDELLQGNPATRVLSKDRAVHRVRAELAGHRTASAEFVTTGDQLLDLKLEEISKEPKTPKGSSTSLSRPKAFAGSPISGKSRTCAEPFYVDVDGIKKIKPACL